MATWTSSGSPTFNGDGSCTINATGSDLIQGPAELLTDAQGWCAARIKLGFNSSAAPAEPVAVFTYIIASSGYIYMTWSDSSGLWRGQRYDGTSGPGTVEVFDGPFFIGDRRTLVWAWTSSNIFFSLNGAAFTSVAGGTVPVAAPLRLNVGSYEGSSNWMNSDFFWACGGTGTLTDANAATLNAFGDSDPTWPTFGSPTFLWPATSLTYQTAEKQSYYAYRRRATR